MGGIPTPAAAADLVERAIAVMVEESGLSEHVVRRLIEMEAKRSPASLPFLARVKPGELHV